MRLSVSKCDLTPTRPCWQGGYVQREKKYDSVHDPIMATVFVISVGYKKIVWVGLDVSGVQADLSNMIVARLKEKGINILLDEIVFGASHTHSGPLVGSYFNRPVDEEYISHLVETLTDSIIDAYNAIGQVVQVKYSSTLIDGLYSNRNDKNKLSDKYAHMLGFFEKEKLIALFFTMAHHCTVLGPNFTDLSADLFGELRRLLEKQFNAPVLMAQGNAGDMGNKQYRKSNLFDEVEMQANNISEQISKKMSSWLDLEVNKIDIKKHFFHTAYDVDANEFIAKKAVFEKQLETEKNFDTIKLLVTGLRTFERKLKEGSKHVEIDMPYQILNMGDLQIVLVPGELGSILGLRIKEASKAKVCIVWAYVNPCHLGYMIEKEAYNGFSQESNVTNYPAGIADKYIEDIIENL